MSSAHYTCQDGFDHLKLTATRPCMEGLPSHTSNATDGTIKKKGYAEPPDDSLSTADEEIQRLLMILSTEKRKTAPIFCNYMRPSSENSLGILPPPKKFCRKAKSAAPVLCACVSTNND